MEHIGGHSLSLSPRVIFIVVSPRWQWSRPIFGKLLLLLLASLEPLTICCYLDLLSMSRRMKKSSCNWRELVHDATFACSGCCCACLLKWVLVEWVVWVPGDHKWMRIPSLVPMHLSIVLVEKCGSLFMSSAGERGQLERGGTPLFFYCCS